MTEFEIEFENLSGKLTANEMLSLRVFFGEWIAARAETRALLEHAADQNLPFRIIARVGNDEVPLIVRYVRRVSEVPS